MNMTIKEQIEGRLKKDAAKHGIVFSQLDLSSAANSLGLMAQIEINYPSKVVKDVISVEYPDPQNPGTMINRQVEQETRVLMTDEEAIAYQQQVSREMVIEYYAAHPEELPDFIKQIEPPKAARKVRKAAAPAAKKRSTKASTKGGPRG